jgi:hypothetical protein
MMQTDVQTRKTRGRLSRHVQAKLGETLHAMFDEIVKEGVPDRFSKLLDEIEESRGRQGDRVSDKGEQFSKSSALDAAGRDPDSLVRAQGPDQPFRKSEDKGSS